MGGSRQSDHRGHEAGQEAEKEETKEIFIVGGGTSVQEILDDPEMLADFNARTLMGCNKSIEHFDCDYMVYYDHGNFRNAGIYSDTCEKFNGDGGIYAPFTQSTDKRRDEVHYIKRSQVPRADMNGIFCGNNCGTTALSIAVALDFNRIYLLGMDARTEGNKTHYHNGYKRKTAEEAIMCKRREGTFEAMATHFEFLGKHLTETRPDIEVFNCSYISLIDIEQNYFKRMHITRALYGN